MLVGIVAVDTTDGVNADAMFLSPYARDAMRFWLCDSDGN
jgi:hypothetical protein